MMKEITLGELLKQAHDYAVMLLHNEHDGTYAAIATNDDLTKCDGPTPEDALQALAEAVCGPDTLLDLGCSRRWEEAHGPDGGTPAL